MKYKINVGGKGAEVYIHELNEDQVEKLQELDLDSTSHDEIEDVLDGESLINSEIRYLGCYNQQDCWYITIINETGDLFAEIDNDSTIEPSDDFDDYEVVYDDPNYLIAEDYVKGDFFSYNLELDEEFDINKLTSVVTEIGENITIITGLRYDGKLLEDKDYDSDFTSKGTYFSLT
jgi:hypothetical protein